MPSTRRQRIATYVPPRAGAPAKAALAEKVLESSTASDAARATVQWLGEHTEVQQAVCAVVDPDERRLVGIVADGISHAQAAAFGVELEQENHPLVLALSSREPILFRPSTRTRRSHPDKPFGPAPFHAIPLRRPEQEDERGLGLLLVTGLDGAPDKDVQWAGLILSAKLLCLQHQFLRARQNRWQRQRRLLKDMVDSVSDPILVTNAGGQILQANTHAERLFTAGDEESEGRQRAVALNNMLFSAAAFTESTRAQPGRREVLLVDPSTGEDLLFELINTPIRLPEHDEGVVSVLRNVSDLRQATREIDDNYRRLQQAEAEARGERDRLDLILKALADPVLVTRPDGEIIRMNPPAERLFASSNGTAAAAARKVLTNHTVFSSFVSNFYAGHSLRACEHLVLQDPSEGIPLPMEAIAGKVIDGQGTVDAVVTIFHDRREAIEKARLYDQVKRHSEELEQKVEEATIELIAQNEQLRRQTIALEEASRLKSQFLANVSHELRTPLHAIVGYTDLLIQGIAGQMRPRQLEKLQRVESNANHLLKVIGDLLDIARIEAGKMPLQLTTFEISALLEEIIQEIEPVAVRADLTLEREVASGLPPLHSDRKKVKQIVINLLSNAIKFTQEGSVRVRVDRPADDGEVCLSVSDTGIGIRPEDIKRIFEDFSQLDSPTTRNQSGTGLGLAICRRLADSLGGRITVASDVGKGSTFTLHVPLEPPMEGQDGEIRP